MSGYSKIVHTEEGRRDGLQIEISGIETKGRLLNALSDTRLVAVGSANA